MTRTIPRSIEFLSLSEILEILIPNLKKKSIVSDFDRQKFQELIKKTLSTWRFFFFFLSFA